MDYNEFCAKLASESDCTEAQVKALFLKMPEVLMDMEVGDKVETPLGDFNKKVRESKRMKSINADKKGEWIFSKRREVVALRIGPALRKLSQH